jgi:trehalose 6-phosphate phosphatase
MTRSPLPLDLDPDRTAFFLDCDGTLAEIVAEPSLARVEPDVLASVRTLHERCGGALAIVSGRSIAQLDGLFRPLSLPVAGVHGLERRDAAGHVRRADVDTATLGDAVARIDAFVSRHPGLICEAKPCSVALHYRMRPDLEGEARELASALAVMHPSLALLSGKAVVELCAGERTKGDAIAAFMSEPPFAGRLAVFAGDDVTDESAFEMLATAGGITIKVGEGETRAAHRVATPAEFHDWLAQLAARWTEDMKERPRTGTRDRSAFA